MVVADAKDELSKKRFIYRPVDTPPRFFEQERFLLFPIAFFLAQPQ